VGALRNPDHIIQATNVHHSDSAGGGVGSLLSIRRSRVGGCLTHPSCGC
jgi:hypothetical protein